jgi:hypothetical protein
VQEVKLEQRLIKNSRKVCFRFWRKKSLTVWILFSCIITLIVIGFNPTIHTFPDYVTIIFLALGPFMHRTFQRLVAILDAVSSVPLLLPYPLADLDLNKCFSQWPLWALLVNTPLHFADSFHTFVNFSCQWPNINEEIAFRSCSLVIWSKYSPLQWAR